MQSSAYFSRWSVVLPAAISLLALWVTQQDKIVIVNSQMSSENTWLSGVAFGLFLAVAIQALSTSPQQQTAANTTR